MKNSQSKNRPTDLLSALGVSTMGVAVAAVVAFAVAAIVVDLIFKIIKDDIWELGA